MTVTYSQAVRTAASNVRKLSQTDVCMGCYKPLATYGLTRDTAYSEDGVVYCCSDCAMEALAKAMDIDAADWLYME